ncbi:hypothetical protein BG006_010600 [Podila minutissima]|uniref:Crinkler effector protein N-terminal domain-containing protein n=1 Tax=Podila minutissima TaxID=64525 RepID=A0A9P5VPQ5_9FUNG|nr:hypothetical protein BG006_010600 [Podila minutissima]
MVANAFSVKINFVDSNVDDLKKLIKVAKSPLWDYLAADELAISRVSILDDANKQREIILLRDVTFQRELRATESMAKAFGEAPLPKESLHFIAHEVPRKYS